MNLIETQTRARQEPFDFMSVRVADGKKKKLHPCAIQLCDKWKYDGGLGFEITLPFLITHLVKKTGVRTLTVLHNHDNRESPFHNQTRSKSWPWQKALVPTVSFNTEFYGRRDTQSWGLCISLHLQPLLYGYTLESDPTLWSRLSIVLEQRNRTSVLYRNGHHSEQYCAWTMKP